MANEPYWEEQWHLAAEVLPNHGDYIQLRTTTALKPGAMVQEVERYYFGKCGDDYVKFIPALGRVVPFEYFYQWRKRIIPIEETAEEKELIDAYA